MVIHYFYFAHVSYVLYILFTVLSVDGSHLVFFTTTNVGQRDPM